MSHNSVTLAIRDIPGVATWATGLAPYQKKLAGLVAVKATAKEGLPRRLLEGAPIERAVARDPRGLTARAPNADADQELTDGLRASFTMASSAWAKQR